MRIIRYIPSNRAPILFFDEERLPTENIYITPETYRLRKEMTHERFSKMLDYAQNQDVCRSRMLAEYFGDIDAKDCGICDICIAKRKNPNNEVDRQALQRVIIEKISQKPLSVREVISEFRCDPQHILDILKEMFENGTIHTDTAGLISRK